MLIKQRQQEYIIVAEWSTSSVQLAMGKGVF